MKPAFPNKHASVVRYDMELTRSKEHLPSPLAKAALIFVSGCL